MRLKLDKFTIVVIALVVILVGAALFTASRTPTPSEEPAYHTTDEPATPVYNAFLAMQRGDMDKARAQYSARLLKQHEKDNYDPFSNRGYVDERTARRLRIVSTEIDPTDAEKATVTIAMDTYYPGGLFESGSTSSLNRTLSLVREENQWKLDTDEYFFY